MIITAAAASKRMMTVTVTLTAVIEELPRGGRCSAGVMVGVVSVNRNHYIHIDYLMVGLRYGFYPRVTDVISQTSEVRASE